MAHSILSILALEAASIIRGGFDTMPQKGFEAAGIHAEFGIPKEGQVVAQHAMRRARQLDKASQGRSLVDQLGFSERYGEATRP